MAIRYDEWPEAATCTRCDQIYDYPTRDACHDGAPPSSLCRPCERREDFFRLLALHRANHDHPRGQCRRELRRAA